MALHWAEDYSTTLNKYQCDCFKVCATKTKFNFSDCTPYISSITGSLYANLSITTIGGMVYKLITIGMTKKLFKAHTS